MKEVRNRYFKLTFEEGQKGQRLMSGIPLPDPDKGPYHFINCDVHPRLWECCRQVYNTSSFTNTYIGGGEKPCFTSTR